MNNGRRIPRWLVEKGRRLWEKLPWWGWGLIGLGIAIVIILVLPSTWQWLLRTPEAPGDQNKYLLSATAQVLGALFALVFSVTLIATQLVTKYTHRTIRIIFNWKVTLYMSLFAGSVILPLWCLSNPTGIGSLISVGFGSLMVILLIPFFRDLKKRMNIEWIINYLKEEGLKAVKKKDFDEAERAVKALDNIEMGAYTDRNFEVFEMAAKALLNIAFQIEVKTKASKYLDQNELLDRRKKPYLRLKSIFDIQNATCEEVIDNPRAPRIIIKNLGIIGEKADKKSCLRTWGASRNIVVHIANLCNKDSRERLSIDCFDANYKLLKKLTGPNDRFGLIDKELTIYDRHLDLKWIRWLRYLLESTLEFIPEFELSETIQRKIFKRVWITAARFENEDHWRRLGNFLRDKGVIEAFFNAEVFREARRKWEGLGIKKVIFDIRWVFLNEFRQKPNRQPVPS